MKRKKRDKVAKNAQAVPSFLYDDRAPYALKLELELALAHYAVDKWIPFKSREWAKIGLKDLIVPLQAQHDRWLAVKTNMINTTKQPCSKILSTHLSHIKRDEYKIPDLMKDEMVSRGIVDKNLVDPEASHEVADCRGGSDMRSKDVGSDGEELK